MPDDAPVIITVLPLMARASCLSLRRSGLYVRSQYSQRCCAYVANGGTAMSVPASTDWVLDESKWVG